METTTGNDEMMPVEESGNMLIMTLSYVQKTGDQSLISNYVCLLFFLLLTIQGPY